MVAKAPLLQPGLLDPPPEPSHQGEHHQQLNTTLQLGSQALLLQLPGADLVWTSQVLHGFHGEVDLQLSGWGTTMTTDISAGAH